MIESLLCVVRPAIPDWVLLLEPHVTDEIRLVLRDGSRGTGLLLSCFRNCLGVRDPILSKSGKHRIDLDAQPIPSELLGHKADGSRPKEGVKDDSRIPTPATVAIWPDFLHGEAKFCADNPWADPVNIIGHVDMNFFVNLSGRQARLGQGIAPALSDPGTPPIDANLLWQCYQSDGSSCGVDPNTGGIAGSGYTDKEIDYPPPLESSFLEPTGTGNGRDYSIHLNWNWLSEGTPNPSTIDGRFNATPVEVGVHCQARSSSACTISSVHLRYSSDSTA
jgi:hypothetical protein